MWKSYGPGTIFRHKLFIFYVLLFIQTLIRDIREVVNMNYANFYCISITGYIQVALWNEQLGQHPMSRLSDQCSVHGWHCGMGKTLLACSRDTGVWNKLFVIIHWSIHLWSRAVQSSNQRPLVGRLFYRFCLWGLCYRDKDVSSASRDYGAVYQASKRSSACGYFGTTSCTESGLSHKPRIVMCHIKEIIALLSLVTFPRINPYVDILIWSYP